MVFLSELIKWKAAPKIIFHTQKEFKNFSRIFRKDVKRLELKEHHQDFQVYRKISKDEARTDLNLAKDKIIFLCIGFIQPNKGFDRVARIFKKINPTHAQLYIVGSIRVSKGEYLYYMNHLQDLTEGCDSISIIDKFISDEEFDTWTCAADYIVCPYRKIWSSGIIARAKLFGKRVIATNTGGLRDQLAKDDILFETDLALAEIVTKLSSKESSVKEIRAYSVESFKTKTEPQKRFKIAFVIPWYGLNISGGAEFLCRRLAEELVESGQEVEVLTTCMRQFESNWGANYYPEGLSVINGVKVRRFRVEKRDEGKFQDIKNKLLAQGALTEDEEHTFISEMIKCPRLYEFISKNKEAYNSIIFMPYMYSTTYYGSQHAADKAFFIPCLHDEPYARLEIYKNMLASARGILFNSEPEYQLAKRLYQIPEETSTVTGAGIDDRYIGYGKRFKKKYGLDDFILYVGRRIEDKNYPLLVDYFRRYKRHNSDYENLKLVAIGNGDVDFPWCKDIIELGFTTEEDKHDAYAAAKILVQPSTNESFSFVMMEAWIAGVPVLVNARCEATKYHCIASDGGLYFENYEEFHECLKFILQNDEIRKKMGENGYFYVISNFNWQTVIGKYLEAIE